MAPNDDDFVSEDERRGDGRLRHSDSVIIKVGAAEAENSPGKKIETLHGTISDISPGGLKLSVSGPVSKGAEVVMWFRRIDRSGTIVLSGVTKWVSTEPHGDKYPIGVELSLESDEDRAAWKNIIVTKRAYND